MKKIKIIGIVIIVIGLGFASSQLLFSKKTTKNSKGLLLSRQREMMLNDGIPYCGSGITSLLAMITLGALSG